MTTEHGGPATTPSQTVGPFFALPGGLPWPDGPEVVGPDTEDAFLLRGRLLDGAGEPVPDGLVEMWQADEHGRFAHPDDPRGSSTSARGFGRCATGSDGEFWFRTVRPGALPTPEGEWEAPHIDVTVLARGLLDRVVTRIYFPDEEEANAADPVLSTVDQQRRGTLIAGVEDGAFRFDIRLQGTGETVFFAV
ncbi:protocatechuate 3,4-dioxygenase alpha subunit [Actinopolyspora biskrensis]|uniref:Protocatechuate 3,4-dioxygenase alpha subunit n=1 Tax=Actinopolyspora biskrensis TaxID=1470178 RepID=A0A852ZG36_9ACTN|nr:protocatechuate 3,4-dioxygenase subunit alpha [Actinopolyspora biskrensis]NYH80983.1 protocatechuate 3,4-dioxygenase alpha subunit [Actinopolyspora biskrensis]